jgi:hypothetical protein
MNRGLGISSIFAFCVTASGQAVPAPFIQASQIIENMLQLPSPAPPAGVPGKQIPEEPMQSPHFSVPADDAPIEELGGYWAQMGHDVVTGNPVQLSDKVRQRLLEYTEQKPDELDDLLPMLPDDRATFTRVKGIYDKNSATQSEDWKTTIRSFLETHGGYFHQELLAEARNVKDDDEMGSSEKHEALERLTTVDWPLAEPLLSQFSAAGQPRTALLAKTLLYRHAISVNDDAGAKRMRAELQTVVADRKALGYSRATALEALLDTEWPSRDDWYLSLFHDPTLRKLRDGYQGFSTLTEPVRNAPDHWIPIMTRLVSNPDRAVHDNAVESLIQFQLRGGRRDALEPLLPWLFNPKWSSARDRLRLIQTVPDLDMKEAVPGLISVVGEEKADEYERSYAAESLAHFRDPRAVPALRVALSREKGSDHRRRIIQGLIACGGVAPEEAAAGVEQFAQFTLTSEGQEKWGKAAYSLEPTDLPAEIALGGYLAQQGPEDDRAAELLVKRIDELRGSNRALADRLQKLTSAWKSTTADRAVLRHLREGSVTATDLASALDRRESMQKTVAPELKELESLTGFPSGIAAVLGADHEKELAILASSDLEAIEGLLAAARLVRDKLPIAKVDALTTLANPLISKAVEEFLITDDTPEARTLVLARHKGEAMILGARMDYDPGHYSFRDFDALEDQLKEEIVDGPPGDESFALFSSGYWGNNGQIVLRVLKGAAELMYINDHARYLIRTLTAQEWSSLRAWLDQNQIDDLGPLNMAADDGIQYEFLHLNRNGGRRIFLNNPGISDSGGSVYSQLVGRVRDLISAAPMTLHYRTADKLPGFEVLLADTRVAVTGVWNSGTDLRIGLAPEKTSQPDSQGKWSILEKDLALPEKVSWFHLEAGHLKPAPVPDEYPSSDPPTFVPKELEEELKEKGYPYSEWQLTVAGKVYRVGSLGKTLNSFWELASGRDPRLIAKSNGEFGAPVISPDGRWTILATYIGSSWADPNFAVRVNLSSGVVSRIAIPEANRVEPLGWVSSRGRVLVRRYRFESGDNLLGPAAPEYWLADPVTGAAEIIKGEFAPFEEYAFRKLQPAQGPATYWAAIPDRNSNQTTLGIYDEKNFAFQSVMTVPGILFDSRHIWVDQQAGQLYITYEGHLLRARMPAINAPIAQLHNQAR